MPQNARVAATRARGVVTDGASVHHHGAQDRGETENQHRVGDVAADHVAHRESRRAGQRRIDADRKLGNRGAEADDDDPDYQGRDSEPRGKLDCPAHHDIPAHQQQGESGQGQEDGHRGSAGTGSGATGGRSATGANRDALGVPAGTMSRLMRLGHASRFGGQGSGDCGQLSLDTPDHSSRAERLRLVFSGRGTDIAGATRLYCSWMTRGTPVNPR